MNLPIVHTPGGPLGRRFENYPSLNKEQEYALAMRLRDFGDADAAHKLIVANLRNVVRIAMDYEGYGLPMEDIIQEGTIGLMIAVKKYDPRKGYRLMTYATWWIKAMIHDYVLRFFSQVKIGTTKLQKKLFYGLNRLTREAEAVDGSIEARSEAISARLDVNPKQVEDIIARLTWRDQSLDSPIAVDSDASFLDFLTDARANPEEHVLAKEDGVLMKDEIAKALTRLSAREQDIVRSRIMAEAPATLEDLGKRHNISKERVRQIENAVMAKLKAMLQDSVEPLRLEGR